MNVTVTRAQPTVGKVVLELTPDEAQGIANVTGKLHISEVERYKYEYGVYAALADAGFKASPEVRILPSLRSIDPSHHERELRDLTDQRDVAVKERDAALAYNPGVPVRPRFTVLVIDNSEGQGPDGDPSVRRMEGDAFIVSVTTGKDAVGAFAGERQHLELAFGASIHKMREEAITVDEGREAYARFLNALLVEMFRKDGEANTTYENFDEE